MWAVRATHGDCEQTDHLPAQSFDACVTDPPYGLTQYDAETLLRAWLADEELDRGRGYQGLEWDKSVPGPKKWRAVRRLLKPGAYLVAFSAPRTLDLLGLALRLAGFEVRDMIGWCYSTGQVFSCGLPDGGGTGLKGSWEPALLCRNPHTGTLASNVEKWGTGGLRVYNGENSPPELSPAGTPYHPANLVVDDTQPLRDGTRLFHVMKASGHERDLGLEGFKGFTGASLTRRETGSAGIQNRRAGAGRTATDRKNPHATVKPLALGEHLTKLVTKPGQLVLDPFCGSGSFGMAAARTGRHWLGIDIDRYSVEVANARIAWALKNN